MNIVGETFLRHCLKPRVECDLPGRLRMRFRHSEQLSKEAQTTSSRRILRWVDIVVDTGLEIAKEIKPEEIDEQKLEQIVRQRLILRLPQAKEG